MHVQLTLDVDQTINMKLKMNDMVKIVNFIFTNKKLRIRKEYTGFG